MAPFYQAVKVQKVDSDKEDKVYTGVIDPEWTVGAVPNGGYVLALLVEACMQHQAPSNHPDPIHVTAHYLTTTSTVLAEFEIRIRIARIGRRYTNLTADLYQQGVRTVATHQIYGSNSATPEGLTLKPPSSYARRIPLYSHPSTASIRPVREVWNFSHHMNVAPDPQILAKNATDHPNRTNASTVGGDGLEWGAWFTFQSKDERITSPALAFLVDIFTNMPGLMPRSERPGLVESWFPTMVLAIEFKAPIPRGSMHSNRSVGLYSSGKFLYDGRHDGYVEVWTAPCDIGEGEEVQGWREKQICLAIATQMAYVIPIGVNLERAKRKDVKL